MVVTHSFMKSLKKSNLQTTEVRLIVCLRIWRIYGTSELNITGRLPEAGNLKPNITRPPPEKTCAAI